MKADQSKMIENWENDKATFAEQISVQHYYRLKNSTGEVVDKYELKLKSCECERLYLSFSINPNHLIFDSVNEQYVNLEKEKSELNLENQHQSETIEEHLDKLSSAQKSNDQLEKANKNLAIELEDLKTRNSQTKNEVDHLTALFKSANDEVKSLP